MNQSPDSRLQAAVIAGWWTLLIASGLFLLQWIMYLGILSAQPRIVLTFWGPGADWHQVRNVWFWFLAGYKVVLVVAAFVLLWLTLHLKHLRASQGPDPHADSTPDDAASSPPGHTPTPGLYGWITHTELASADPDATKAWCEKALGWVFLPSIPTPEGGVYHVFSYSSQGGGGIRPNNPPEVPGSIPYVHVEDTQAALEDAIRAGAAEVFPATRIADGVTVAIVRAPGGVPIGFSGP